MIHDDSDITLYKLKTRFKGKTIFGLQVRSGLNKIVRDSPARLLVDLTYLPTVNARVMGFQYARLVTSLSKNVKTADKFSYNGLKDWSLHQYYRRQDQVERPIELTNYAHPLGKYYTISTHPDFSLGLKNLVKRRSKLTFFLWKTKPSENQVPDFVFQVILKR